VTAGRTERKGASHAVEVVLGGCIKVIGCLEMRAGCFMIE
jgi:hypothetical protein